MGVVSYLNGNPPRLSDMIALKRKFKKIHNKVIDIRGGDHVDDIITEIEGNNDLLFFRVYESVEIYRYTDDGYQGYNIQKVIYNDSRRVMQPFGMLYNPVVTSALVFIFNSKDEERKIITVKIRDLCYNVICTIEQPPKGMKLWQKGDPTFVCRL